MYSQTLAYIDQQLKACAKGWLHEHEAAGLIARAIKAMEERRAAEDALNAAASAAASAAEAFFSAIGKPL